MGSGQQSPPAIATGDERFGDEACAQLLAECAELGHAKPGAACVFRDAQAGPAHRAHLAPHRAVEARVGEA